MTQTFTPRERQVIEALIDGDSPKEIGSKLGISEKTVSSYIASAKIRVKARTRDQLASMETIELLVSVISHEYGIEPTAIREAWEINRSARNNP